MNRLDKLLEELESEFPQFRIRRKSESRFQRAIALLLFVCTMGGQRTYMTEYHTVLFGHLWVPTSWDQMTSDAKYILLRHERVHLRQRARLGDLLMALIYLVPFFPIFLAYGRARIEWEAYEETLRATTEVHGIDAAKQLKTFLIKRFTGADYGWMWPFPRHVETWFNDAIKKIQTELPHESQKARPA